MTPRDFEEAMAVRFWAPLHAMLAAIPHMRRQGGGRIVNISSIGDRIGVPHLAPYCASKFALAGVSDTLRAELAKDRISVTTVLPGLMRTGSPFNAWFKGRHRDEFTWFALSGSIPGVTIDAARISSVRACRPCRDSHRWWCRRPDRIRRAAGSARSRPLSRRCRRYGT